MNITEIIELWNSNEGKPYKGSLIDWSAYEADPENMGCMCAQGQVLHAVAGWSAQKLRSTDQAEADLATAKLLNISRAHAILLRSINDKVDGAPAIVLTDPEKVIGNQWSKLLNFWWHIDTLDVYGWQKVSAARAAARAAAGDAARAAAGDAAGAAWDAAGAAAWEIQGANIFAQDARSFFFLSMFGFSSPDDIPARAADYGVKNTGGHNAD